MLFGCRLQARMKLPWPVGKVLPNLERTFVIVTIAGTLLPWSWSPLFLPRARPQSQQLSELAANSLRQQKTALD
jgi:hypothetical protein